MTDYIKEKVKNITSEPGVYLWKDEHGNILYIGKAKNLKKRLNDYLLGHLNSFKTSTLMEKVVDFDVIVVNNEKEALIQERILIEKHKPYFNILLTDDAKYPYIKIMLTDKKLEIQYKRFVKKEKHLTLFYGPFPNGGGANIIKKMLERIVYYKDGIMVKDVPYEYWKSKFYEIKEMLKIKPQFIKKLEKQIEEYSENYNYKLAQESLETLNYLKKMKEKQFVQLDNIEDIDVVDFLEQDGFIYFYFLFYRYGVLINKVEFAKQILTNAENTIREFLNSFYDGKHIPNILVLPPDFRNFLFDFDDSIDKVFPESGIYFELFSIARKNNEHNIKTNSLQLQNKEIDAKNRILALEELLNISDLNNIIIIDNSHTYNNSPVSVVINYLNGYKNKNGYRKFNLEKNNNRLADVEYLNTALRRYFKEEDLNIDLLIVDGGLIHVREAKFVLDELDMYIPVVGLVKDDKHRTRNMINLDEEEIEIKDKKLFNFLSEIQYEVDRFAKSHHRKKFATKSFEGELEKIKGLGTLRIQKLLNYFKSYENIYSATEEELSKVVPEKIAKEIIKKFSETE